MKKYKLSMKTPSGLGTEYVYVESKYDNFERYLKEHNLKYQKYNFKTEQDKEIERLHSIIKEVRRIAECYERIEGHYTYIDSFGKKVETFDDTTKEELLEVLDKVGDIK